MTDLDGFPRGYRVWSENSKEPDVVARLLAEQVDTLDEIRNEANELNANLRELIDILCVLGRVRITHKEN